MKMKPSKFKVNEKIYCLLRQKNNDGSITIVPKEEGIIKKVMFSKEIGYFYSVMIGISNVLKNISELNIGHKEDFPEGIDKTKVSKIKEASSVGKLKPFMTPREKKEGFKINPEIIEKEMEEEDLDF